jgi:hypothetical protein
LGWRLPTREEWIEMVELFGGIPESGSFPTESYKALVYGGGSGFNAQLGGWMESGNFERLTREGIYWTSEKNTESSWVSYFGLYGSIDVVSNNKSSGNSCRCVQGGDDQDVHQSNKHEHCMLQPEQLGIFNYRFIPEKDEVIPWRSPGGLEGTRTSHNLGWEQHLFELFDLKINMEWYDDSSSPNAFATPYVTNRQAPDGTIALGRRLSKSMDDNVFEYIIYHELGHIIDYKFDLSFEGKYAELFADYFSGFIMGYEHRGDELNDMFVEFLFKDAVDKNDLTSYINEQGFKREFVAEESFNLFHSIGDYNFNSPKHHGTPSERSTAIINGFKFGYNSFNQILVKWAQYLGKSARNEIRDKSDIDLEQILNSMSDAYSVDLSDDWGWIEVTPNLRGIINSY